MLLNKLDRISIGKTAASLFEYRDRVRCASALHHHHHHQSLNREGRWCTTDDFAISFLHFPLFSTAPWDLPTLQACSFPDVVFPPLPLSALSSSPFHCALLAGFGQPDERET